MGIIFSFLLKILTIFRLLLGGFLALPDSQPPNIQSTLFEILTSDSIQGNASDICYCFYCIIKKWLKLSQKTGSLAHFERFFNYTLLHPDKLHTPIFCQIKHLMLWHGRYIHNFGKSLVQHLQSVVKLQIFKSFRLQTSADFERQLPFLKLLMPPRLKTETCVKCFLFFLSSKVQM